MFFIFTFLPSSGLPFGCSKNLKGSCLMQLQLKLELHLASGSFMQGKPILFALPVIATTQT